MKKNVTYVDAAKFETIIRDSGLTFLLQKGFVKVSAAKGRNLYVAATKRVGRVDISGFTVQMDGITDLGDLSFGNVKQQLDFSRTEDEILATFRDLLAHMATLPAVEKMERKASTPRGPVAQGWSQDVPKGPTPEEVREQRKALIAAKAEKRKAKKQADSSQPEA